MNPEEEKEETMDELFKSIMEESTIAKFETTEEFHISNKEVYKQFEYLKHVDCDELRPTIPSTAEIKVKPSVIFKMLRDLIGKDLSKFALPVFINEPAGILMKGGEYGFFSHMLEDACKEPNSIKRLAIVIANFAAVFNQVMGRITKPFNPLLGETYEFIGKNWRFLGEMVSHHPPVFSMVLQGDGWEITKSSLPM